MEEIIITRPDDFHHHFRDGDMLPLTVRQASVKFGKVVVMPNLIPPITTVDMADFYRTYILNELNNQNNKNNIDNENNIDNNSFTPLMALYLTKDTTVETIKDAGKTEWIIGFKYYPKNGTTNSGEGVSNINEIKVQLEAMEQFNVPLLIHGEIANKSVDIFDKEMLFVNSIMPNLIKDYPNLKIVLEHISTKEAVDFVINAPHNVGATITPHHLLLNRNNIFKDGLNPHYYCLPILKRLRDQIALIDVATSGNPKFFLGTDSAPHIENNKLSCCGCAGIFNTPVAIEICATIFEKYNALNKLEAFISLNGANFYELPINKEKIKLVNKKWRVPLKYRIGNYSPNNNNYVVPLLNDEILEWQICNDD